MTKPTSMTELEAVNIILTAIGEAPINTLAGNQVVDVAVARQILNEVSREVQSQGWYFNTETRVPLSPDLYKNINLPADTSRIDIDGMNVVVRDSKLFDLTNRTFEFTSIQYATIVYYQDFEIMPDVAKRYVAVRSSRIFSDRMVNSDSIHQMLTKDEQRALIDLKEYEGDTADYNMMDNYSVSRVMNRGFNRGML
jgi:hypothetical protein